MVEILSIIIMGESFKINLNKIKMLTHINYLPNLYPLD